MPTTKKKEEQTQLPVQNVSNQNQAQQAGNGYQSKWQPQINDAVNQYMSRGDFKYNVNEDALYQQMKDMYVMQGQKAMLDTMGQTTALTGGYGNSWAQGAGQQAYQGYIQQLNDNIPDLYQMALNQYMSEGDQMAQNIGMMMDQDAFDYGRYQDQLAAQEDAYDKLVALMENYHYEPTEAELAAAGMPVAHKNAIMQPYYDMLAAQQAANSGGGDGPYEDPNKGPVVNNYKKSEYYYLDQDLDNMTKTTDENGNRMEKSEVSGVIREAVAEGKITQNQAQALLKKYTAQSY